MLEEKALRYKEIFAAVFFDPARLARYTDAQRDAMRHYLDDHIADILCGNPREELHLVSSQVVDRRGRNRKAITYRPGLTLLMRELKHIHTLVVTDLSRLSRNHFLFGRISKLLLTDNVRTIGLMLSLSFMNSREIGDKIQAQILPLLAEHQLREILLNTMRGILMMLESGKPHGKLPCWLTRDMEGNAVFKPKAHETMERMIDLFLTNDENDQARGFKRLERALTEEGHKPLTGYARWNWESIQDMLGNPALIGIQWVFGLDFPVFPRLICDERYQEVQACLKERSQYQHLFNSRKREPDSHPNGHMITGLLRCACGKLMNFKHQTNGARQYVCYSHLNGSGDKTIKHTTLKQDNVDEFLNELMEQHAIVMLHQFKNETQYREIEAQIAALEQDLQNLNAEVREQEAQVRREAEEKARTQGVTPENPVFGELVNV